MTEQLQLADLSSLEDTDWSVGGSSEEKEFKKVPYLPGKGQAWPINVRILVNPLATELGRPYYDTHMHYAEIGGRIISIPCPRSLGQKCPLCDASWHYYEKAQDLEKAGAKVETSPNNERYKQLVALNKLFKPRKQSTFLAALPGDEKIYMFYAGPMLIKAIFGDKKKNVVGAVSVLRGEYAVSAFGHKTSEGWIALNKTGKGLDTVYTAAPSVISKVENKRKVDVLMEQALHPNVVKTMDGVADIPRILETFKSRLWTEQEMTEFVDSLGTAIPERLQKFFKNADKPSTETANFNNAEEDVFPDLKFSVAKEEPIEDINPF